MGEKTYRIRTKLGINEQLVVDLEQDFEFLEILSMKFKPDEVYPRSCSDFGVIAGRVIANNGYGIPNAKISIFVPLSQEDANNPIISSLYPYHNIEVLNEDGYRYNLLPYEKQHSGHVPTGTFPSMSDTLEDPVLREVYDKYYKYTVKTNESGDYMIFGAPLGNQTLFMDLDLSDMGPMSMNPQDLIRMGLGTESMMDGSKFKASENLDSLPQIVSQRVDLSIEPFWGQEDICQSKIHRFDFDLRKMGIEIQPTAVFMGSILSDSDRLRINKRCKPKTEQGNLCSLITGVGEVEAIRQTIFLDADGRPVLEEHRLDNKGRIIDEDGTWVTQVPMNMDYITTNEFGETVISPDPKVGVPTTAKYRFKVKWHQSNDLRDGVRRGYYLVPNVREYWYSNTDPVQYHSTSPGPIIPQEVLYSYAFSLDWNDYGDVNTPQGLQMIGDAIDCKDKFFILKYNKVYTISQLIDQYHNGAKQKFIGIKEITSTNCETQNNKFPTTDGVKNVNLMFSIVSFVITIVYMILLFLIPAMHIIMMIVRFFIILKNFVVWLCEKLKKALNRFGIGRGWNCGERIEPRCVGVLKLPLLTYPDCDFCECGSDPTCIDAESVVGPPPSQGGTPVQDGINDETSVLPPFELADTSVRELLDINSINDSCDDYGFEIACALDAGRFNSEGGEEAPLLTVIPYSEHSWNKPWRNTSMYIGENNGSYLGKERIFSCELPLAEKINLFNTKAKYFENDLTNQGNPAVNQIKVSIDPSLNPNKYHYDNVFVMLVSPTELSSFKQGRIVTFQDRLQSTDPNVSSPTSPAIGGLAMDGQQQITVEYADPNTPIGVTSPPLQTIYNVNFNKTLIDYSYPSDIEYFQVLTGMTYTDFAAKSAPSSGLFHEYINYPMQFKVSRGVAGKCEPYPGDCPGYYEGVFEQFPQPDEDNYFFTFNVEDSGICNEWQPEEYLSVCRNEVEDLCEMNSIEEFSGYDQWGVIVMVRGVDMHSERVEMQFDLSRIFGETNYGNPANMVSGKFRMNIPIQPNLKLVRHDSITANGPDINGEYIHYKPYNADFTYMFNAFNSNMHTYYSSLDSSTIGNFQVNPNHNWTQLGTTYVSQGPSGGELRSVFANPGECSGYKSNVVNGIGYGEYIEGGSYSFHYDAAIPVNHLGCFNTDMPPSQADVQTTSFCDRVNETFIYFAPKYSDSSMLTMSDPERIVFRSDRLPTSTTMDSDTIDNGTVSATQNNAPAGQQNNNFTIYQLNETSFSATEDEWINDQQNAGNDGGQEESGDMYEENSQLSNFLASFECDNLKAMDCYSQTPFPTNPLASCNVSGGRPNVYKGCYFFVKRVVLDIPNDLKMLTEWAARLRMNMAACMNIFSHTFVNSWVNGTLYHFNLKNNRFFNSNNEAYSVYCSDVAILDPNTNNYYYRSSPYNIMTGNFISRLNTNISQGNRLQAGNLQYPTTIMDMGPVNSFVKELTLDLEHEGYIADKFDGTSYKDITELLQVFFLNRLLNSSTFLNAINVTGSSGANALFKNNRGNSKKRFDGDYAQTIQINSQFGIFEFSPEFYDFSDLYMSDDPTIGVWFDGDNEMRDLISPRRLIFDENTSTMVGQDIPVATQEVPSYKWKIDPNSPNQGIFGTEDNDWQSTDVVAWPYQDKDRIDYMQNYFKGGGSNLAKHLRGFITNVDAVTGNNLIGLTGAQSNLIEIGNPWYFYFGLKEGSTAIDKFFRKYVE